MKHQGHHPARAGCVILKHLKLLKKSLLKLYQSELAKVEQSQAGINAHILSKKFVIYLLVLVFLHCDP